MSKPDGGPAFPAPSKIGSPFTRSGSYQNGGWTEIITEINTQPGMSLRDWFAGQALAGFCSIKELSPEQVSQVISGVYRLADAMLAERAK